MRFLSFAASSLSFVAVSLLGAAGPERVALAAGGIAGSPAPPSAPSSAIVEARVAVARAGTGPASRTTLWSSVRVDRAAGGFVWLVPARRASAVDVASDAWLDALEAVTAPRVLPPAATLTCDVDRGTELVGALAPSKPVAPIDTTMLPTLARLDAHLTAWGFVLDAPARDRARTLFDAGDDLVAMTFSGATSIVTTPTLRVVGDEPLSLPMVLTRAGTDPIRVTAFAFATTRMAFGEARSLTLDGRHVTWSQSGKSTYGEVRDAALASSPSGAFFVEAAGPAPLFGTGVATVDGAPLPSVVREYPARLAALSRAQGDAAVFDERACVASLGAGARLSGSASEACPRGDVASLAQPDGGAAVCVERPAAGETSANAFRCEGVADDLAFAVGGAPASSVWITRAVGTVRAGELGRDVALRADPGPARTPVIVADTYGFACPTAPTGSGSTPAGSYPPGSGGGGGGGAPGGGSFDPGYVDPTTPIAVATSSDACSGSTASDSSSDDSCGGGATTPRDSSGAVDDAGADTSSEAAGDACGTDTGSGSSNDASGDGCGSDDGSASGDDDACMGDSSGSSSDDSCDTKPADATPAKLAAMSARSASLVPTPTASAKPLHRHASTKTRSPVSRAVLGFALLLAPLRRKTRKT